MAAAHDGLVTFDRWEVPHDIFAGPGAGLDEALAGIALDTGATDAHRSLLPAAGWRTVCRERRGDRPRRGYSALHNPVGTAAGSRSTSTCTRGDGATARPRAILRYVQVAPRAGAT